MESPAKTAQCQHAAIAVQNLTFTYPERERPALQDVSLTVNPGEFIVLCGPSGCGKTTLLRQLKPMLAPHGAVSGKILFEGTPLRELSQRDAAAKIGFVLQSPENQIVTDKVWHDLRAWDLTPRRSGCVSLKWRAFSAFKPGFIRTSRSCQGGKSSCWP